MYRYILQLSVRSSYALNLQGVISLHPRCTHSKPNFAWSVKCRDDEIRKAVQEARRAVEEAAKEGSDDADRDFSVESSTRALRLYDSLLRLTPNEDDRAQLQDSIGRDVDALKQELFMSRKQRVWMAVDGWF